MERDERPELHPSHTTEAGLILKWPSSTALKTSAQMLRPISERTGVTRKVVTPVVKFRGAAQRGMHRTAGSLEGEGSTSWYPRYYRSLL